jgi:hypothetical protein
MPRTTCPAQLGVHELWVSVADALREDFDGVEAAVTDNVDIGRRADDYRKNGTAVASSVCSCSATTPSRSERFLCARRFTQLRHR